MFKSIDKNVTAEIVEKKSKFIAHLFYIETVAEAEEIIKEVNKKYFDSRHNCYAFCVYTENGMVSRFSDDGEPSGTAGAPMLKILTSQNLSNMLVIVTRYFGGILLGTGGLVKAYTLVTTEALEKARIVQKDIGQEVKLVVNYSDLEKLKYYFKQNSINILNIEYGENASVIFDVNNEKLEKIMMEKENLNFTIQHYEIIKNKFIEV